MKLLLIDNYDSFTYNVVHVLRDLGVEDVDVRRNTQVSAKDIPWYGAVIASPGPGLPCDAGQLMPCIEACLQRELPYLGICLGHQALGEVCGYNLRRIDQVYHGVQDRCTVHRDHALLTGLGEGFDIGRYHSWVVDGLVARGGAVDGEEQLDCLATSADGVCQAMAHRSKPSFGVQFHPESIMAVEAGPSILRNFLTIAMQRQA